LPETRVKPSRAKVLIAFAIVYVVWGSTYIFIRFAIDTLPPFLMGGTRYFIAGTVLFIWARAHGAQWPTRANWRAAFIAGTFLFLAGNGAVIFAETRIPSGVAALIVALVPIWMALLAWLWHGGSRPRVPVIVGLLLGFIGLVLLVGPGQLAGSRGVDLIGAGVLCVGSFGWAFGTLYAKEADLPKQAMLATSTEMIAGGVLLLVLGLVTGEAGRFNPGGVSAVSVLSLLFLIVFGSLIAFSAYMWLLVVTTPARLSTYAYVNPVVAMFLGWAFAHEQLTLRMVIASVVILAGVALLTISPRSQKDTVRAAQGSTTKGLVRERARASTVGRSRNRARERD
jgi:drug/metabolite transporter (DMT)-like permease